MGDLISVSLFLVFHLGLISPGLVMGVLQYRRGTIKNATGALLLGYAVGYAFEILVLTLFMYLGLPTWLPAVLGALTWGLLFTYRSGNTETSFRSDLRENRAGWFLGLVGIVMAMIVLSRVGRIEDGYHVFTTLFVNDYFNHMAVSAELAKNVPPTNIYYHGPEAHYYWFFHIVPGAFHQIMGLSGNIRHLLMVLVSCNILMLFAGLHRLLMSCRLSRRAAGLGLGLILIGYSYMDLFIIGRWLGNLIGIGELIPAIGKLWPRVESFSGLSHSYVRDFFVEPHAVAATLFGLTVVSLQAGIVGRRSQFARGLLIGLLTLACFGCDSFMGTIVALWLVAVNLIELVKTRRWRQKIDLIAGVAPVAAVGYFFVFGMHMIGGQSGMLSLQPMKAVIATLPLYLTLDYGPLFILGVAGWWRSWRDKLSLPVAHFWLMAVIALFFGLFVRHSVEPDILLRKSGKPLQLVLLVGAAIFLNHIFKKRGTGRKIVIGLIVLAAPTLLLDLQAFGGFWGSRGLENKISTGEVRALKWIRKTTEPNAVVQGRPGYPGDYLYDINPIPALAERSVGVGTFMLSALWGVGAGPAIERIERVNTMFNAESTKDLVPIADDLKLDYLYLGPHEKSFYRLDSALFFKNNSLFKTVYDSDSVTILRYKGPVE